MGQYMFSNSRSYQSIHIGYDSMRSKQLNNYLSPRLNNSNQDFLKNSTASFRSTRSSIYSQSSKLLKSSIFQRVAKNADVDTASKKLEQKQAELQSLKSTTKILKSKISTLQKQLQEQVKNGLTQSKKLRGYLKQFYNN